jgi:hypothetical protein
MNLLPANTGLLKRFVSGKNAKERGRFRMKGNGGERIRIILSLWARSSSGGRKGNVPVASGRRRIKSIFRGMKRSIKKAGGNICRNTCVSTGRRKTLTDKKVSYSGLTTSYLSVYFSCNSNIFFCYL